MTWAPAMIGPVAARLRAPNHSWTSVPTTSGQRAASLAGVMQWPQAQYLSEMVANAERAQTVGAATGVLEWIDFGDDDLLRMMTGWYLLSQFDLGAEHKWSGHGIDYPVAFTLGCSYLGGSRRARVVSSSRPLANDYGRTGVPVVVDLFVQDDAPEGKMLVSVGDALVAREYDPTVPMASMGPGTEPRRAASMGPATSPTALYPSPTLYPGPTDYPGD